MASDPRLLMGKRQPWEHTHSEAMAMIEARQRRMAAWRALAIAIHGMTGENRKTAIRLWRKERRELQTNEGVVPRRYR